MEEKKKHIEIIIDINADGRTSEVLDYAGLKLANEDETPDKEDNQ